MAAEHPQAEGWTRDTATVSGKAPDAGYAARAAISIELVFDEITLTLRQVAEPVPQMRRPIWHYVEGQPGMDVRAGAATVWPQRPPDPGPAFGRRAAADPC